MPDGPITCVALGTHVPLATDPDDVNEWSLWEGVVSFAAHGTLMIKLPWGEVLGVRLPILEPVTTLSGP